MNDEYELGVPIYFSITGHRDSFKVIALTFEGTLSKLFGSGYETQMTPCHGEQSTSIDLLIE